MAAWDAIIGEALGVIMALLGIVAYYGFRYGWRRMYGRQQDVPTCMHGVPSPCGICGAFSANQAGAR